MMNMKFPDLDQNKIEGDESMQLARAIFKASQLNPISADTPTENYMKVVGTPTALIIE
jgi:hypothetical protein